MRDTEHDTTTRLIGARTVAEVQDAAEAGLEGLTGADNCALEFTDDSASAREGCSAAALAELGLADEILDHACTLGKSFTVDDLTDVRSASAQAAPDTKREYRSLLCVPVGEHGRLVAVSYAPTAFSKDDLDAVERLGSAVAAALDRVDALVTPAPEDERLEAVASVISHDLRNPLTVAQGFLDLERAERDSDNLDRIGAALGRLDELIDDLVLLARTGESVNEVEPVELDAVAERAWTTAGTRDATLEIVGSTTILADESSLRQLLENVFRNAVDHAGPSVTVRVGLLEGEDGFFVADDGPGIAPDDRPHVFEYGYSTTSSHTGFGLSIVERIATAHGWDVTVTTGDGGGARFEFAGIALD